MTAEIVVQIFRFGFLALLWLFILVAFRIVRADLLGGRARRVSAPARSVAAPGRRSGRPLKQLRVTAGPLAGTRITLGTQTILIGRADDSTLVLTDDFASSRHARLTQSEGRWYVEDLGSTNGTYLDQQRVQAPLVVAPGQPIRIGTTIIELHQ